MYRPSARRRSPGALFQIQTHTPSLSAEPSLRALPGSRRAPAPPTPSPGVRGDVGVAVDEASNLIVVQGGPEDLARIDDLFQRIDRPQKQVLIEASIVEVTLRTISG